MASSEGQSNPSTSGDAAGDHNEDYGNEYGPPLPTQEELREMEHRRLVGKATNMMLNFAKDPKLAKYMTETAFQVKACKKGQWTCKCKFCGHTWDGGTARIRYHLLQIAGHGVGPCDQVPDAVKEVVTQLHADARGDGTDRNDYVNELVNAMEEEASQSVNDAIASTHASDFAKSKKRKGYEGNLGSAFHLQARKHADQALRRFFYADIPEWKVRSPFFWEMVKAIGQAGPSYVPPSYHALRTTHLNDEVKCIKSDLMAAIWENIGTRLQFSSSFHPQTDGQSEIANSVVLDLLKSYISDQKTQWERYLPLVEFAYNNTIHSSTGKAPFEIVEGSCAKVRETLQKSQERQKKAADRHRRDLKLKENDWVLLRFEKARLRKKKGKERLFPKLSMRYYGPFQITERINDVSFRLRLPNTWKIQNAFHVSLLKPFRGDVPDDGEPDEQPEVEENEEILVPEQILAHKDTKTKGKVRRRFLVKFKNYPALDAKWMEEEDLADTPQIVNLYLEAFGLAWFYPKGIQNSAWPEIWCSGMHKRGVTPLLCQQMPRFE
ncbi:hypothetical protein L7F22_067381 [Adiantum nelumboides]|nr:hypothetical protein [Adiantum nelumboides]